MNTEEALKMIQRRRPEAEPIPAVIEILEKYQAKCAQEKGNKNDKNHGKETKKATELKRAAGPVGPSSNNKRPRIGPSQKTVIGPSLPTAVASANDDNENGAPCSEKPTIGPSMPSNRHEVIKNATDLKQKKIIGSTLPSSKS